MKRLHPLFIVSSMNEVCCDGSSLASSCQASICLRWVPFFTFLGLPMSIERKYSVYVCAILIKVRVSAMVVMSGSNEQLGVAGGTSGIFSFCRLSGFNKY